MREQFPQEPLPDEYAMPDGSTYLPAEGKVVNPNGSSRQASLDDAIAAAGPDGKVDVRVVEEFGHTQRLSDGTYYDTEFEIYYE